MFTRLIGNNRAKEILRRVIRQARVPGAMLFTGEDGVGKKLFALELAKALNCRTPVDAEGCDACPVCARINRIGDKALDDSGKLIVWSAHPDVGLILPAGRLITAPQIRELERESNARPFEGVARLFIIEEADRMNDVAANALLKTLEEPPASSHLMLLSARPAALLPTIRSRCQLVRFTPLTVTEIAEYLQSSQGGKLSATDVSLAARAAQGSLGRALALDPKNYREQRSLMLDILDALARDAHRARLLRASESLSDPKYKDEYEERLEILETLIRDIWTIKLGDASTAQLINDDLSQQLAQLGAYVSLGRARLWLQHIEETRRQLAVNINRKIATDALLLTMAGTTGERRNSSNSAHAGR
ncbi:MAG: DNA polymerase III subunit delta' [Pyrinomonadaceae bacterium]